MQLFLWWLIRVAWLKRSTTCNYSILLLLNIEYIYIYITFLQLTTDKAITICSYILFSLYLIYNTMFYFYFAELFSPISTFD